MKKAILVAALMSVSAFASAESWVANGVRQIAASNTSAVQVLPVSENGFASEALCEQFIADQNGLALANNVKGAKMTNHVDATCSKSAD
ncbi:hypothetical protein [Nitrosomonas sp.]|uniref:hypothetical protein n=1 Tax=Nitrosomonas sp. TaxID=42353 RepID=UPI0025EE0928|nr:hypothetical protein [Nitrosomonas sp.]MBY0484597.1 hypothetical protein [Nitrosomonas sp.]